MEHLPVGNEGLTRLTKQQPFKRSSNFSGVHNFDTSLSPVIGWLIKNDAWVLPTRCAEDNLHRLSIDGWLIFNPPSETCSPFSYAQSHSVNELDGW